MKMKRKDRQMPEEFTDRKSLHIIVTSDMHYLSPRLTNGGTAFWKLMEQGDGKYTEAGQMIMEAFVQAVQEEKPDAVLICGDLTFNGELLSLQDMAAYCRRLKEAGSRVFVICGNHDIENRTAAAYFGDKVRAAESVTAQTFLSLMAPYGYDDALFRDLDSCSYAAALRDDLWLLVLDANTPECPGSLRTETLQWAETVLQQAQKADARVISMSHQNVLVQNEMMYRGFVINNHEETEALLKKYDVLLHLSGHCHLSHVSVSGGLSDICTESLVIWPLSYGSLRVDPSRGTFVYESRSLNILQEESRRRFDETMRRMVMPTLMGKDVPQEKIPAMISLASEVSALYFAGRGMDRAFYLNSTAWRDWCEWCGGSFWHNYIKLILET